jgi:hypothetical protein
MKRRAAATAIAAAALVAVVATTARSAVPASASQSRVIDRTLLCRPLAESAPDEAVAALEQQAVSVSTPFAVRISRDSTAREGDRIEVAVDTSRLHFFDLETGDASSR